MLQTRTITHPAFGSPMPTRVWSDPNSKYKYGFNDKELDKADEGMGGGGSTYDYGFRIYNPNLGRFLSVDPLSASYPWYTPYQFAGNDPIRNIDIDGLEGGSSIEYVFTGVGNEIQGSWNYLTSKISSWWSSLGSTSSNSSSSAQKAPPPSKPAPAIKKNTTQPVLQTTTAEKIIVQTQNVVNTSAKKNIDLSDKIPFVSQFSLSNPQVACCRASQKILRDFGISKAGAKSGRIITGRDNSSHTAIAPTSNAKAGVDYINQQLESGNPVMVGLNHTLGKGQSDGEAADHYVVITGRKYDEAKKQYYFNFYEVGTAHESKGTSDKNRLYVNSDNSITGTNSSGKRNFTVTDVRKN